MDGGGGGGAVEIGGGDIDGGGGEPLTIGDPHSSQKIPSGGRGAPHFLQNLGILFYLLILPSALSIIIVVWQSTPIGVSM